MTPRYRTHVPTTTFNKEFFPVQSPLRLGCAAVLAVVGDLLEDIVVRIASTPALGTDTPAMIERRRGGSAANVAAAAASTGATVRFIGSIGDDDVGSRLVADLAALGVDVRVQRRGRTGAVVVLVGPDGERTMLPDRGVATSLADVDAAWLDGVTWWHIPSYSLLSEPIGATVRTLLTDVRGRGGRLSIDVSSVAIVEAYGTRRYQVLLGELAPDVVFANETEARLLPTAAGAVTIVKHGPRPVEVRAAGERYGVDVPPLPEIQDTTGAGDAFAAGFLTATIAGAGVRGAVSAGIDLAARALRR
jgi:sugar/nucleoside kinase (ribokinase family)